MISSKSTSELIDRLCNTVPYHIYNRGGSNFRVKEFLANKEKVAAYLHQAAQTYGTHAPVDEYANELALLGIIPGIAVDTPRGCPKAISIIATLHGEFKRKSNYLKTLCTISSLDGASIVKGKLSL